MELLFLNFSLISPVQKTLSSREDKRCRFLGLPKGSSPEEKAPWLNFGKMADE